MQGKKIGRDGRSDGFNKDGCCRNVIQNLETMCETRGTEQMNGFKMDVEGEIYAQKC